MEQRGLVDVVVDGMRVEARLAHPLYGEVLRSRISTLRARRLRGRLAGAIAATGARRADDTMRRAVLLVDSDLPPDPDLFTRAARQAVLLHDLPLAERLGRAAWEHDPRVGVGLMLAYVQSKQGRSAAAEPVLDGVARLAADDGQRAQIAALRVANLFFARRLPEEALRTLDRARDSLRDPDELRGLRVALVAHLGRLSEAIPAGRQVLATEAAGANARVWAGFGLCHALGRAGRLAEADAAAAEAGAAVRSGGSAVAVQLAHAEVTALALAGALDRAAERAEDQRGLDRHGTDPAGPLACLLAGHVDVACGRVTDGVRSLREARAGVSGRDPGAFTHHAQLLLPHALGMLGEAADARAAQQEAEASRHPGVGLTEPDLLLGRAWVAAAEGVTSEAVVHARHAATTAAGCGQYAVEVLARHTAVCLGDTTAGARLTGLAGLVEGPRVRVAAAHATALAEHDAAGLAAASTAAQAMGALLVAADAAAQASAEYGRAGDRRSAVSCAARAQDLARLCGGAATPALRALAAVAPLTGRERETVALAAAGLSNQDIAARLVVSVRTVEGHLYRAFAKLGVAERSELVSG
ncbi:LuxR C-terminal-related transcriptional regulator [Pseudonocardia saturnea]